MRAQEWMTRLAKIDRVHGLEVDLNTWRPTLPPLPDITYRGIRLIVPMDREQIQLWTVRKESWPDGDVAITIVKRQDLYNAEVLSHCEEDWAVYDGDTVMLDADVWIDSVHMVHRTNMADLPVTFTGLIGHTTVITFAPTLVTRIMRLES